MLQTDNLMSEGGENSFFPVVKGDVKSDRLSQRKRSKCSKRHANVHLCEHCGQIFKCLSGFLAHMRGHEAEAARTCTKCGRTFSSLIKFRSHQKNHPIDGYDCKACGSVFPDRESLLEHIETHDPKERPYICDICGRCFRSKGVLKVHLETHSDEKPYSCSICGMRFRQLTGVYCHKVVHNVKKVHKCSICGREFTKRNSYKNHVKRCSGPLTEKIKLQRTRAKEHKCSVCGEKYINRRTCKHHLNEFLKSIIEENSSITQVMETNNLQSAKEILSKIPFEKTNGKDLDKKLIYSGISAPISDGTASLQNRNERLSNMGQSVKIDDVDLDEQLISSDTSSISQVIEATNLQKTREKLSHMSSSGKMGGMNFQQMMDVYFHEKDQNSKNEQKCTICGCKYSNRLCKCFDSVIDTANHQKTKCTLPNKGLLVI